MEITEVRIKLTSGKNEKLRAFCSITIDNDFVIRDLKVIEGAKGAFVAMPSRKLMARCTFCSGKNHYRAPFCNECGARLSPEKLSLDGRRKLHADVAHPINSSCRESIQQHVLAYYQEEKEKAKDPDYRPVDLDDFDDVYFDDESDVVAEGAGTGGERDAREAASGPRSTLEASGREPDQASRERAVEESEWEEDSGTESAEPRTSRHDERELDRAFGPARASGAPGDEPRDRRPVGAAAGDGGESPGGATRGEASERGPSFQRGGDRGGGRPGSRSRPRSGGRRGRGRDPRREGGRPGERDRSRESGEGERQTTGVGGERSRLAVDFDDVGSGHGRSRRGDSGRGGSGGRESVRQGFGPGAGGPRETRHREDQRGEGQHREDRYRQEATGEPPFRERGRQHRAEAAGPADRSRLPEGRRPERRLAEEVDAEPEDNFGAGLFS